MHLLWTQIFELLRDFFGDSMANHVFAGAILFFMLAAAVAACWLMHDCMMLAIIMYRKRKTNPEWPFIERLTGANREEQI